METRKTQAEEIAERFGNDGVNWRDENGVSLEDECIQAGAEEVRGVPDPNRTKWVFGDGSVITAVGAAWDVGYADCWCWESMGHGDDCAGITRRTEVCLSVAEDFYGHGILTQECSVTPDGQVFVWDDEASEYTDRHQLTEESKDRIRAKAWEEEEDPEEEEEEEEEE